MQMSIWVFTVIMTNKRGAWKHSKNIPGRLRADGDWAVAGGPMTSWWSLPVQRNLDPGWDPDDGELHQLPFSAELGFGEIHLRVLSHEPAAATRDTRQCCHRSHTKRRRHHDRSRASRSGRREASSKHAQTHIASSWVWCQIKHLGFHAGCRRIFTTCFKTTLNNTNKKHVEITAQLSFSILLVIQMSISSKSDSYSLVATSLAQMMHSALFWPSLMKWSRTIESLVWC